MFYVVDADADLEQVINQQNGTLTRYTYGDVNPVNDLIYGYGGVKLFQRGHYVMQKTGILILQQVLVVQVNLNRAIG